MPYERIIFGDYTAFSFSIIHNKELGYPKQFSVWLHTGLGFDPWQRQIIFPLATVSRPALRPTQPPVPGGKALPKRDADHSSPSSAEVKNE
jgi:hypothetical protein